jgi:regulatory protein
MISMNEMDEKEIYAKAVELLARREHSARELAFKLDARGCNPTQVESVLARLQAERLQSDARYTEVYLHQRSEKGYGPQRIRAELQERGVAEQIIAECMRSAEDEGEIDWYERAGTAYARKFGGRPIEDLKDRAKRQRFLQYRGFSHEQIAAVVND